MKGVEMFDALLHAPFMGFAHEICTGCFNCNHSRCVAVWVRFRMLLLMLV